ncbi:hypothetical protein CYMTET_40723 [Cymbomonas tetramitiformis]|uniref:PIH1D1/2/3 CS-like domain-containing protein n=1 Tax=Cymbomonas tetramitiformis TaxID=36881 RepID=A0AAE0C8K9_9CHLO|nr:hypothetical protein CYMTET_40723 [Cymbomonas tetramitiformis]
MTSPLWDLQHTEGENGANLYILLPEDSKASQVELNIVDSSSIHVVSQSQPWELTVPLPWAVDEDKLTAKFQKKKHRLVVSLSAVTEEYNPEAPSKAMSVLPSQNEETEPEQVQQTSDATATSPQRTLSVRERVEEELRQKKEQREIEEGAARLKEVLAGTKQEKGRLELRSIEDLDYWGIRDRRLKLYRHTLQVGHCTLQLYEDFQERWGCPEHGHVIWPSSVVLSKYLEQRFAGSLQEGTRVVELGSGVALPGLAMWALGADVTLTEMEPLQLLQTIARANEESNSNCTGALQVKELDWTWSSSWIGATRIQQDLGGPFQIILGSDLMYRQELLGPLIKSVYLLSDSDSVILMALNKVHNDLQHFLDAVSVHFTAEVLSEDDQHTAVLAPDESERCYDTWKGGIQWRWRHPMVVLISLVRKT